MKQKGYKCRTSALIYGDTIDVYVDTVYVDIHRTQNVQLYTYFDGRKVREQ